MDDSFERKSELPKPSLQLPSPSWLCCLCSAQSSDHQKILHLFFLIYFSLLVALVVPSACCY